MVFPCSLGMDRLLILPPACQGILTLQRVTFYLNDITAS